MNKWITIVVAVLLTQTLAAQEKPSIQEDMRLMLEAVQKIQKGGFYNDKVAMQKGVITLKRGLHSLRATNAKSYLPKEVSYANKFAKKRADMIALYADDMVASLHDNNMDDALNDYHQIINQCTSCHLRMRN